MSQVPRMDDREWLARFRRGWGRPQMSSVDRAQLDAALGERLARSSGWGARLWLGAGALASLVLVAVVWSGYQPPPVSDDDGARLLRILDEAYAAVEVTYVEPEAEIAQRWQDTVDSAGSGAPSVVGAAAGASQPSGVDSASNNGTTAAALPWPNEYEGLATWLGIDLWT